MGTKLKMIISVTAAGKIVKVDVLVRATVLFIVSFPVLHFFSDNRPGSRRQENVKNW